VSQRDAVAVPAKTKPVTTAIFDLLPSFTTGGFREDGLE
jgi:hypothetical protein